MKNVGIGILLVAAVLFGSLYYAQARKARRAQANAEGLRQKVGELQYGLEKQERQTTRLRYQLEAARADATAKANQPIQGEETVTDNLTNPADHATVKTSGQAESKPSNLLSEMFKNPEMKEMIKNQQKTALSMMIDKNYGRLFSDLRLTLEQSAALKDMILNKQLAAADLGMAMFSGDQDATKRSELIQQVKAASDAGDAQIKEFLGDDNFVQFQAYEKTMGERIAVNGFKDQLGRGPTALTDDQEQQLVEAMTQERQNFQFTKDFSDKSEFAGDLASMFTEDKMATYFQELGELNQQYLARVRSILAPDQLTEFEKYLKNQQTLQRAGMQMAVKIFAPGKSGGN